MSDFFDFSEKFCVSATDFEYFLNTYVAGCESNERIAIMHSACKPLHMSSGEKTSWFARQNNNECMAMAA